MTVAALYVDVARGPYAAMAGVDCWGIERDARLYAGPHPVVAHPPCTTWSQFAAMNGVEVGTDDGCFEAALVAVERWGGVLEHPAGSMAFKHHGLPIPRHGRGWTRSMFRPGWSCSVDQCLYGHRARKRTWLYFCGDEPPPELDWRSGKGTLYVCTGPGIKRGPDGKWPLLPAKERHLTPPKFARLLVGLARHSEATCPT